MGTATFERDAVVEIQGEKYRMLRKVSDTCWQLEQTKTARISELEHDQLLRLYADTKLRFINAKTGTAGRTAHVTEILEIAKVRRLYVLAALKASTFAELKQAIAGVWHKTRRPNTPPGYVSVYRWKKRFLASGSDIRALEDAPRKGNRTRRFPSEVLEICEQSINKVYMRRERRRLQDVLDHAVVRVREENQLRPTSMALPLPTRRLLRRLVEDIPAFDRYAARYGYQTALRHFRSVEGHRTTHEPLERAEIDHTHLDLFAIDDETLLPLGRPWFSACEDDYTRCILGVFVGFIPPSFLTVSLCLKDAFRPKTWLREAYPHIESDWPAHGVMRELVLDNGPEFHSDSLEQICLFNGIEMHYAPRKTPWFKGKIERFFRSLNECVAHGTPGTSFSNIFQKDDYDPVKHAIVCFSTLKMLVRKWIADVYHQKPHRALGISPVEMWNSSIRPEDIRVPEDPALLDVVMGRRFARVLTHKGIEFQGLFYNSPELHELRCRNGSELQVEIRVDESDLGRIFVLSPKPREVYAVPALRSDYAAGIGLFQHRVIRQYQKRHAPLKPNADGWLQAKEEIVKIIENETHLKRKRSHQRVARWGDSKLAASLGDSLPPTKTLPARAAPEEARACVLTEAIQDRALKTKDLPVTIQER
jgi:putative transposase